MSRERRLWGILLITAGVMFQLNELGIRSLSLERHVANFC